VVVLRRIPIVWKLLGVYLAPVILSFVAFSWLAHHLASRGLDDELGRRLVGVAASAGQMVEVDQLASLAPGDEGTRTYRNVRRRFTALRDASGVRSIYVFDEEGRALCDTDDTPIGEEYFALSRSAAEVRAARAGKPSATVLFRGVDGKLYKSAFAAVSSDEGERRYVVGVDGAAAMYDDLAILRRTLAEAGAIGVLAVALLSLLAARLLVAPISALERAAARIGRGDLDAPIVRQTRDEIGTVADTLEAMRAQLRSRDERMQMMLAGIAHEVRNPLGGLQLYAGLLREELPPDRPELVEHAKKVDRELEHLKVIVSDFLEYARRPRPAFASLDAAELCAEVYELVRVDAEARGVMLRVDAPEPVAFAADAGQLRRALLNLVYNALQASPAGAEVALCARSDDDEVEISVADHGPGISDDVLEKIWTPFYTTKQKGTGLGLAFVREIAVEHGGRVEVTSTSGGTTFRLRFPRVRPAPTA
jgi:signal transduction histidine kinase